MENADTTLIQNSIQYGQVLKAQYFDVTIPAYQGNPLIEVLPPIQSRSELADQLLHLPHFDRVEQGRPAHERLHLLTSGTHFFQPLPQHLDLAETVGIVIRAGYVGRNPVPPGYLPSACAQLPSLLDYRPRDFYRPLAAPGLTLVGPSGIGKTCSIANVLHLYPQAFWHEEYRGHPLPCLQLVYLQVSCPHDGSRKALCMEFFRAVDQRLSTTYFERWCASGRHSVDFLLLQMGRVCVLHHLGLLVIDEIQNLREAKAQDAAKMLNFFTQLDNEINVPVMLIGTPRARAILTGGFRRARRAEGQCGFTWDRMAFDGTWDLFVRTLWDYQYTRQTCPLTTELSYTLWDESQGVPDIAIKLFRLAQERVIVREEERISDGTIRETAADSEEQDCINVKAIRETAAEHLQFVEPFLTALRKQDRLLLETDPTFDDLLIPDVAPTDPHALSSGLGAVLGGFASGAHSEESDSPDGSAVSSGADVRATISAEDTQSDDPTATEKRTAVQHSQTQAASEGGRGNVPGEEAVARGAGDGSGQLPAAKRRKNSRGATTSVTLPGSLLHVIGARRKNVAPYDALSSTGYIRSVTEYLTDHDAADLSGVEQQ